LRRLRLARRFRNCRFRPNLAVNNRLVNRFASRHFRRAD
jgi:hypothetical protein